MVGRRGKSGAAAANANPATRAARNATASVTSHAPRARGRGRGRGRWATRGQGHYVAADAQGEQPEGTAPKRSLIVRFKLPALQKSDSASASQADSDPADASSAADVLAAEPETPRGERSKRPAPAPGSSRTTRQSARLKSTGESAADEASPSKTTTEATRATSSEGDADADATDDEDAPSSPRPAVQEQQQPRLRIKFTTHRSAAAQQSEARLPSPPLAPVVIPEASSDLPAAAAASTGIDNPLPTSLKTSLLETSGVPDTAAQSASGSPVPPSSPRLSRKRKSSQMKDEPEEFESAGIPGPKKPKLEGDELTGTLDTDASPVIDSLPQSNGTVTDPLPDTEMLDVQTAVEDESPAEADELGSQAPTEGAEPSSRGRGGRGRGRGRGRARGGRGGRGGAAAPSTRGAGVGVRSRGGRGRGRGRASATAAPIKDRAEELAALFKKVGQAQQLALNVLAERSMQKLARDKNVHKDCVEHDQVMRDLAGLERKAMTRCRNLYDLQVAQTKRVLAGDIFIVEQRAKAQIENIKEEMFYAVRGKYMELVTGRRAAEDDEHTEASSFPNKRSDFTAPTTSCSSKADIYFIQTDGSDAEVEEPRYLYRIGKAGTRQEERGFVAEPVRVPEGAAAYERGKEEWEDFVTKARVGEDLNPQMQALDTSKDPADDSVKQRLESLLQAARTLEDQSDGPGPASMGYDGACDLPPTALAMLADTALSGAHAPPFRLVRGEPQHIPSGVHRALLPHPPSVPTPAGLNVVAVHQAAPPPPPIPQPQPPQAHQAHQSPASIVHGPTDPRSFILPRPTPTQQPRRLLPAQSPMGISLPNPFAMAGPPQLPPPPGSHFARLPMPQWHPGPPPQAGQQPTHSHASHAGHPHGHPHPHSHPHGPGPSPGPGNAGSHGGPSPHQGPPPSLYYPPPQRRY
ncbi:hypothetical protein N7539_009436 [Penicillium diatomitis]|uniref:Uncharacterized protein n=1 Tax=Penicillium diatomitis TaxID=2819901 RepID=A0A9X0BJA1_9EURO|nr:uncharacterized protein N7539_009436 [Penicillium diatomitis]KAJ5466707.1 hypothetical protein N7539_009436 [Penicillium diatomitis]